MFNRLKDERGFTLIELLVVVLIIGILAAVALPTFLGQRDKGFDADAKSNARNLQTMVESCGIDNAGDFSKCDTAAELQTAGANPGALTFGTNGGNVGISGAGQDAYTITAYSKAKSGAAFKQWKIAKTATAVTKSVVPANAGSW
jgi:type IV pilus assembly protein PilA